MCHACQNAKTIKYVLIECIDLAPTRETFYNAICMKELFKKIKVADISKIERRSLISLTTM